MKSIRLLMVLTPLFVLTLAACSQSASSPAGSETRIGGPKIDSSTTIGPHRGELIYTEPTTLARMAIADLAERLAAEPTTIDVIGVVPVKWPDASPSCKVPDMADSLLIGSGFLVVLKSGADSYEYLTNLESLVVFCGSKPSQSDLTTELRAIPYEAPPDDPTQAELYGSYEQEVDQPPFGGNAPRPVGVPGIPDPDETVCRFCMDLEIVP